MPSQPLNTDKYLSRINWHPCANKDGGSITRNERLLYFFNQPLFLVLCPYLQMQFPQLLFDFFAAQLHQREYLLLKLGNIDTHTSTTDLVAVTDDVILFRTYMQRIDIQPINMRLIHTGERIVLGLVTLVLLIEVQKRKIDDPA